MAETTSLKELREENANAETNEVETAEVEQESTGVIAATEEVKEEAVDTESTDDVEIESWMQTEVASSEDDQKGGFKPNHEAAKTRKRLKAKLHEKDDELETMRQELERLKSGQSQQAAQLPPRPKREDFDYDDDAYDSAVDEWNDKKLDARLTSHTQKSVETNQQEAQQKAYQKRLDDNLNGHYNRVSKLVGEGKVTEDAYNAAETHVRSALERIRPGAGDQITDSLISTLNSIGEGSEKVMYQLGVNPSKLAELESKFASDPSGLTAVAYLGSLQSQVSDPIKRRSSAPKPGANVQGEGGAKGQAGTMKKAYDKAGASNDIQARISMKRKAKAQGIDVSNW